MENLADGQRAMMTESPVTISILVWPLATGTWHLAPGRVGTESVLNQ